MENRVYGNVHLGGRRANFGRPLIMFAFAILLGILLLALSGKDPTYAFNRGADRAAAADPDARAQAASDSAASDSAASDSAAVLGAFGTGPEPAYHAFIPQVPRLIRAAADGPMADGYDSPIGGGQEGLGADGPYRPGDGPLPGDDPSDPDGSGDRGRAIMLENRREALLEDLGRLRESLAAYLAGFEGEYGLYLLDIDSGCSFGINDSNAYLSAGTSMISLSLYLYAEVAEGRVDPTETMILTQADISGGPGTVKNGKVGDRYPISELSALSVAYGDETAANMLMRLLGRAKVTEYASASFGDWPEPFDRAMSPAQLGGMLARIHALAGREGYEGMAGLIGSMLAQARNDRLNKLLPVTVRTAHVVGNAWDEATGHNVSDAGIVYDANPYVIVVMSRGVRESEVYDVIANASKMAYDFMRQYAA
ncbi:MAG: class A beta-lactamase-related serine hydrolase [Oscillospiraceae bacterium]|nr:class A beta-lactamase-related serine hydrolase [Oscillospiraceae bacterium]